MIRTHFPEHPAQRKIFEDGLALAAFRELPRKAQVVSEGVKLRRADLIQIIGTAISAGNSARFANSYKIAQREDFIHRILVVDDEPVLLKVMGMYLMREGFQVITAATAETAWAAFAESPGDFDVAVVDASISGPGLASFAKQMAEANPRLCLIAASGYPLDMSAVEAVAPGRVMFLQKPFTSDMLGTAVRRMLAVQEKAV